MWKKWFSKNSGHKDITSMYDMLDRKKLPGHVAIIMDGNGRWAKKRGLLRAFGHRAGVESLREIVKAASQAGIQYLTAYAFSTENWKRPAEEVNVLMSLLSDYLDNEIDELHANQVRIQFVGKTKELAAGLQQKIEKAQRHTAANQGLVLTLAVNYGGRAEIVQAVQLIAEKVLAGRLSPQDINQEVIDRHLYTADLPDPDLLIRPSGDMRISNFLLWQMAYTEIWLTETYWPDFTPQQFLQAISDYQKRERRFGGLKDKPKH